MILCVISNQYAEFAAQSLNDEYDRNALYQRESRIHRSWIDPWIMNHILMEQDERKPRPFHGGNTIQITYEH